MSSQRGSGETRKRAQKHKNSFAFKNDLHDKTWQMKKINSLNVCEVCERCKAQIEWRIKYKKYKPLSQAKTCVKWVYSRTHFVWSLLILFKFFNFEIISLTKGAAIERWPKLITFAVRNVRRRNGVVPNVWHQPIKWILNRQRKHQKNKFNWKLKWIV